MPAFRLSAALVVGLATAGAEENTYLGRSRSETELGLMKALKQTLAPKGILNPGKVLA